MDKIYVTKAYLPPKEEFDAYVNKIWDSAWLTNEGPIALQFEQEAKQFLGVENFQFVANGTLALQLAIRSLGITEGEIITTPFSYVATVSSILWERCKPVFVDIDPETLCIDPSKIEAAITENTKAIIPVHVFGNACDIENIEAIASKHNLKTIYDGAHAFAAKYQGKSLLSYGDVSTCSFHATKPFHTIEGGCVITKEKELIDKVELMKRFGHNSDEHYMLGINAKGSEFNAAMGLCNLKHIDEIISKRKAVVELYDSLLNGKFPRPKNRDGAQSNYAYYPVILPDEATLKNVVSKLEQINVYPRRYFFPSLNLLPYLEDKQSCPVSEDIASRILCLPLYGDLNHDAVKQICEQLA